MEQEYKKLRNKYLPTKIKAIFILESPPASGAYFYNPEGRTSEILFRSLMQSLFGDDYKPATKSEGLTKFKNSGYLLVDPIYMPVDKLPDKQADELILRNYPNFIKDLEFLGVKSTIKLILIKKNICLLLAEKLKNDGFNVINNGLMLPFPMHYHIKNFKSQLRKLLNLSHSL